MQKQFIVIIYYFFYKIFSQKNVGHTLNNEALDKLQRQNCCL